MRTVDELDWHIEHVLHQARLLRGDYKARRSQRSATLIEARNWELRPLHIEDQFHWKPTHNRL